MKIAFVRGAYLNNYESQNYIFRNSAVTITAFASKFSLHHTLPFPVVRLWSTTDVGVHPAIANRILGDGQVLLGIKEYASLFDIFHTADPHYYYSYQLAQLRAKRKIPCLLGTSWETIPFNNETVRRKKYIKRFAMKYIDHFLCYTERAEKCLIAEGVASKKISVIPLGVDLEKFKRQKLEVNSSSKKLKVLFTGRLVPEKGIDDLKELMRHITNADLLIAHNSPYNKMPELYQTSDIFVMPSKTTRTWEEQYGMSLIEAMASGLPIVAYASGSIPELLGNTGMLIREGDVSALSRALHELIAKPDLRKKLGRMSEERARKLYDSKKTAGRVQKLYEYLYRNTHKK